MLMCVISGASAPFMWQMSVAWHSGTLCDTWQWSVVTPLDMDRVPGCHCVTVMLQHNVITILFITLSCLTSFIDIYMTTIWNLQWCFAYWLDGALFLFSSLQQQQPWSWDIAETWPLCKQINKTIVPCPRCTIMTLIIILSQTLHS